MQRERGEGGEARAPQCSLSSRPIRAFLTLPLPSDLRTEPALESTAPFSAEQRLSLWEGKRLLAGRGHKASKAGILAGFGASDINNTALNEKNYLFFLLINVYSTIKGFAIFPPRDSLAVHYPSQAGQVRKKVRGGILSKNRSTL